MSRALLRTLPTALGVLRPTNRTTDPTRGRALSIGRSKRPRRGRLLGLRARGRAGRSTMSRMRRGRVPRRRVQPHDLSVRNRVVLRVRDEMDVQPPLRVSRARRGGRPRPLPQRLRRVVTHETDEREIESRRPSSER